MQTDASHSYSDTCAIGQNAPQPRIERISLPLCAVVDDAGFPVNLTSARIGRLDEATRLLNLQAATILPLLDSTLCWPIQDAPIGTESIIRTSFSVERERP
jgi:hypothetical protein